MSRPKTIVCILSLISIGVFAYLWLDPFHDPVETIHELIGKEYEYAVSDFYGSEPNNTGYYSTNDRSAWTEFNGPVLGKKAMFKDTIVYVYTWAFSRYKSTIWVAKTDRSPHEIVDAIRYKDGVRF